MSGFVIVFSKKIVAPVFLRACVCGRMLEGTFSSDTSYELCSGASINLSPTSDTPESTRVTFLWASSLSASGDSSIEFVFAAVDTFGSGGFPERSDRGGSLTDGVCRWSGRLCLPAFRTILDDPRSSPSSSKVIFPSILDIVRTCFRCDGISVPFSCGVWFVISSRPIPGISSPRPILLRRFCSISRKNLASCLLFSCLIFFSSALTSVGFSH
mmetsp:Transcript_34744/g.84238  ORF Transcript_34744/g.84238 Transcript_34744/m.84238 type:complete len:213 (-) Transcript_34744:374-1012(-)